jgi:DNA-binding beta-propeller fold protein YncE
MRFGRFPIRELPNRKVAVAALLAGSLLWVLVLGFQYHETRKPLPELPAVPKIGKVLPRTPPGYLHGFYGNSSEPIAGPVGIAASAKGERIYVTEGRDERQTVVFDRSGNVLARLAPPGTVAGGRIPASVALAPNGDVYVSDRFRGTIDVYSPGGEYLGVFAPAEGSDAPEAPLGLAFDSAGNLYVTDLKPEEHRLLVYTPEGRLKLTFGREGAEPGQFAYPYGIAVDGEGRIYVADSNNGRVQRFDRDGRFTDMIGRAGPGAMGIPRGIALDAAGRLFIVDLPHHTVKVWDVTVRPRSLYEFGGAGMGDGQLAYPSGLALDATGRVYVADRANNRVQIWSY